VSLEIKTQIQKWFAQDSYLNRNGLSDVTWVLKHRILSAFFQHWGDRGVGPKSPMPKPKRALARRALIPRLYSIAEVQRLFTVLDWGDRPLAYRCSSATLRSVLLFLYGTGARIGEALSLKPHEIDLEKGVVQIGPSNHRRTIPIGPDLCKKLRTYTRSLNPDRVTFFITVEGRKIRRHFLTRLFRTLVNRASIHFDANTSRPPRVLDFRRTFAITCVRAWIKQEKDLRQMLPILSAYLGHVNMVGTEAYLGLTPERFVKHIGHLRTGLK
jgi:integrase/recombinase XerD